jgi:hypothetical protein
MFVSLNLIPLIELPLLIYFNLPGVSPILPFLNSLAQDVNESVLNWTEVCQLH